MESDILKFKNKVDTTDKKFLKLSNFGLLFFILIFTFYIYASSTHAAVSISRPVNNLGLVGYWNFNTGKGSNVAWDLSGQGNNGKLTNMDVNSDWVVGKSGQGTALDFDGTDDHVQNTTPPTALRNNWTVSAWINPANLNQSSMVVYNGTDTGGYGFGLSDGIGNTGPKLTALFGNVAWIDSGYTFPSANAWYHVVMLRNSGTTRFYVNGAVTANTTAFNPDPVASRFSIGSEYDGANTTSFRNFSGKIDEVRVYNRVLSPSEIERLYKITQPEISTVPLSRGLVGYWNFNSGKGSNVAWDLSGQGNNGKLTNMDVNGDWVVGKMGTALDFDGSNDLVLVLDSFSPTAYTYSMWIKPTAIGSAQGYFCRTSVNQCQNDFTHAIGLNANGTVSHVTWDGVYNTVTSTTILSANKWYFVTITAANNNVARLYINGVEEGTPEPVGTLWPDGDRYEIGADGDLTYGHANGVIDEVRAYSRVLSAAEIQQLYKLTQPKIATAQLDRGLVGYWDFNFGKGQAAVFDRSSYGNDGILQNTNLDSSRVASKNSNLGRAIRLSGDDVLRIARSSSINLGTTMTIAFWMNGDSTADFAVIMDKMDFTTLGWAISNTSGAPHQDIFMRVDTSGGVNQSTACGFPAITNALNSQWHHIVFVLNNGVCKAYKDGALVSSGTYAHGGGFANTSEDILIDTNATALNIIYDEIRLYSRELTIDEIYRLYLMGK